MSGKQGEQTADPTGVAEGSSTQSKKMFKKEKKKPTNAGEQESAKVEGQETTTEEKNTEELSTNTQPEDGSETQAQDAPTDAPLDQPETNESIPASIEPTLTDTFDEGVQTKHESDISEDSKPATVIPTNQNEQPTDAPDTEDTEHDDVEPEQEPSTKMDVTDVLVALQEQIIPLLSEPKQNKLNILQFLDRQTQLLKEVDPNRFLFEGGVRDLDRKLYAMDMFISGVSSIIDCEIVVSFSEFLLQTTKITELFNRFIEYTLLSP